jgi:hypothetical protein
MRKNCPKKNVFACLLLAPRNVISLVMCHETAASSNIDIGVAGMIQYEGSIADYQAPICCTILLIIPPYINDTPCLR